MADLDINVLFDLFAVEDESLFFNNVLQGPVFSLSMHIRVHGLLFIICNIPCVCKIIILHYIYRHS